MKKITIQMLRLLPALFIFACSWHLSSQSHIDEMPDFWNADKLVHLVCFAGLTFWVAFGVDGFTKKERLLLLLPIIIVSVYGMIDETHQSYVPGRSADVLDWLTDTAGAVLGSVVYRYTKRFIVRKRG